MFLVNHHMIIHTGEEVFQTIPVWAGLHSLSYGAIRQQPITPNFALQITITVKHIKESRCFTLSMLALDYVLLCWEASNLVKTNNIKHHGRVMFQQFHIIFRAHCHAIIWQQTFLIKMKRHLWSAANSYRTAIEINQSVSQFSTNISPFYRTLTLSSLFSSFTFVVSSLCWNACTSARNLAIASGKRVR